MSTKLIRISTYPDVIEWIYKPPYSIGIDVYLSLRFHLSKTEFSLYSAAENRLWIGMLNPEIMTIVYGKQTGVFTRMEELDKEMTDLLVRELRPEDYAIIAAAQIARMK